MADASHNSFAINPRVTWEGCSVLLDINDGDRLVFARLSAASTLKIGNKNYSLRPLIGCPFGSSFQIENGPKGPHLYRCIPSVDPDNSVQESGKCQSKDETRDNRALVDNNKSQSLTGEDIDAMRRLSSPAKVERFLNFRQGATGGEIVEALIANSATFEKKTLFSQEKYRLRKQKKYAPKVLLRRPFARSICEAYFKKYPARIGFLRIDALSLLLSLANVSANSHVLVVDMVGGLVTGSVAERLGGVGYVCSTYHGNIPSPIDIVRIFNFGDDICRRITRTSLSDLTSCQVQSSEQTDLMDVSNPESHHNDQMTQVVSLDEIPIQSEDAMVDVNGESTFSPVVKVSKSPKPGNKAPEEVINAWKENGFTSLIIAAPELDPWSLLKDLLPLLSSSAPFAVYHQNLQPLATCMHNLQLGKMAIGLQISEPWLREYQVLPSRTHPCMQMSAFGGYILSGTRLCDDSN